MPWSFRHPHVSTALGALAGGLCLAVLLVIGTAEPDLFVVTLAGGAAMIFAVFELGSLLLRRPVMPALLSGTSIGPRDGYTPVDGGAHAGWSGGDCGGGGGGDGGGC